MALKRQNMVAVATGSNPLALTMESGYSAIVKKIRAYAPTGLASNHSVSVDNRTIFQFVGPLGLNYFFYDSDNVRIPILEELYAKGLLDPIPVAEGQTLGITAPGTDGVIEVEYDLHDAGDFTGTEKNGKDGKSYQLFQVVSNAAAVAASGPVSLNQSDLSTQFPRFPGGAVVPAGMKMTLRALFGSPVSEGSGAANIFYTERLRLLHDREDITDLRLQGMIFRGLVGYVGAQVYYTTRASEVRCASGDQEPKVKIFDPAIVFPAGAKLDVIAEAVWTGGSGAIGAIKLGMLFDVDME